MPGLGDSESRDSALAGIPRDSGFRASRAQTVARDSIAAVVRPTVLWGPGAEGAREFFGAFYSASVMSVIFGHMESDSDSPQASLQACHASKQQPNSRTETQPTVGWCKLMPSNPC